MFKTHLALDGVPHLLLMFYNLLVMVNFEFIKFVHLLLEDRQSFPEALEI